MAYPPKDLNNNFTTPQSSSRNHSNFTYFKKPPAPTIINSRPEEPQPDSRNWSEHPQPQNYGNNLPSNAGGHAGLVEQLQQLLHIAQERRRKSGMERTMEENADIANGNFLPAQRTSFRTGGILKPPQDFLKKSYSTSSTSVPKSKMVKPPPRSRSNTLRWKNPVVQTPPPWDKSPRIIKPPTTPSGAKNGKSFGTTNKPTKTKKKAVPPQYPQVEQNSKPKTKPKANKTLSTTGNPKKESGPSTGPSKKGGKSLKTLNKKQDQGVSLYPKPLPLNQSSQPIPNKIVHYTTTPIPNKFSLPSLLPDRKQPQPSLSDFVTQAKSRETPPPFPNLKVCDVLPGTSSWDAYWADFYGQIAAYNKSMENYTRGMGEFTKDLEEYARRLKRSTLDDLAFQAQLGLRQGDKKPPILHQPLFLPITIVGPYVIKRDVKTKGLSSPTTVHLTSYDHQSFRLEIGLDQRYLPNESNNGDGKNNIPSGPPEYKTLIPNDTYFISIDCKFNMLLVRISIPSKSSSNIYKEEVLIACPPEKSVFTDLQVSSSQSAGGKVIVNGR